MPFILLLSCKKEDEVFTTDIQNIYLYYKNSTGQNLLNSSVPKGLMSTDIDILDLNTDGHKIYFQNSGHTNAISEISHPSLGKIIKLPFQNGIKIGNKLTKYLQYSAYKEDKITVQLGNYQGKVSIYKIWLNDHLIATQNGLDQRAPLTILK